MTFALASSFRTASPDPSWTVDRPSDLHRGGRVLVSNESGVGQNESARRPHAGAPSPRDLFVERVTELVAEQQVRAGSRMLAYRAVGRALRVSDTWVRRLLYGQPVRIDIETVDAADTAYARFCARREATARALLDAAIRREGRSDAILARLHGRDPRLDRGSAEPDPGEDHALDRALPLVDRP